ncbi:hypothetical protein CAP35_14785 [Chitinophagaceae bacterium IBVUCB1]|nr:hypothetical protein CAP35_14785 [Chitinophagaceae bacterium IBVUCB1]
MKIKMLLFTATIGLGYLSLSSYSAGPSASAGHVAVSGCGSTGSCHGAKNTATAVAIVIKDGVTTITNNKYTPGKKYAITITGTNSSKTQFGYQFSATKGTSSVGTISNIPTGSKSATASGITVVEQSAPIASAFGLLITFDWTAPAAGNGPVTLSAAVNAVDGTGGTGNDVYNTTQVTLTESTTGIQTVVRESIAVLFPNPATNVLNIQLKTHAKANAAILNSFGQKVKELTLNQGITSTDVAELPAGLYYISIATDGENVSQTLSFIRQ